MCVCVKLNFNLQPVGIGRVQNDMQTRIHGLALLNVDVIPVYDHSHVALIAQLGEHCTGIAEVMGLNPAQSLNFSRSLFK